MVGRDHCVLHRYSTAPLRFARANAEGRAFGRRNDSLFAALFLVALVALTFVVLRGT